MNADQLAQYFDHTQLRAYATDADFETLCAESRKYHFRMYHGRSSKAGGFSEGFLVQN